MCQIKINLNLMCHIKINLNLICHIKTNNFSLTRNVQTCSRAHPASCSMGSVSGVEPPVCEVSYLPEL